MKRFKQLLNSFLQSNLFKVSFSTGLTSGMKIIATVVLSKLIAIKLGPPGLALLGQLSSFVTIALLLSTGGFGNGIIKYVAELKSTGSLNNFVSQSFKLTVIISCITGATLFATSNTLSNLCFDNEYYNYIFKLLGVTIILYAVSNYFVSFLNGMADFRAFNWCNGLNSIFSLLISLALIETYSLKGAFIAVALNQTISCFIAAFFIYKYLPYFKNALKCRLQIIWFRKLLSYSSMAMITALLVPTSQLYLRKTIMDFLGNIDAGKWEAINRISSLYLSVLINIMLVYYLPKLSTLQGKSELKAEIKKGFKFFLPFVIGLATCLFFLKNLIINLFLSSSFSEIKQLFLPQLIGDIFKVLSFLYAYLVISKTLTFYFIFTEVLITVIYLLLSKWFLADYGVIGVVYAYMISYIFYFFLQYLLIGKVYLNENINTDNFFRKGRWL